MTSSNETMHRIFNAIVQNDRKLALRLISHKDVTDHINDKLTSREDAIRQTCLHVACNKGSIDVARKLLEYGASPDATDNFRSTPLQNSASQGNLEMVKLLVEYQADVTYKDIHADKTAYDKAVMYGRLDAAEYLYKVEHGSRNCECQNNAKVISRLRQTEDRVGEVENSSNQMQTTTKDLQGRVAELELQLRQLRNENYPKLGMKSVVKEDPRAIALYERIKKNFLGLTPVLVARNHIYFLLSESAISLADVEAIDKKIGGNQARATELLMILLSKPPETWVYSFIKSLQRYDSTKQIAKQLINFQY